MSTLTQTSAPAQGPIAKLSAFWALLKFRLTAFVVFSGAFGYLLAAGTDKDWGRMLLLLLGSTLITGAANTFNQMIERDLDKLMRRTSERPLPTGRLNMAQAGIYALLLMGTGFALLYVGVNPLSAWLSLLSLVLYAFVYTPLKQLTPLSVLVGAFPGAFPPLIGWAAYSGEVGPEALALFGIQFIWQFPHFWAIAWVGDQDYKRAGFKLLPYNGEKNPQTAVQIMLYTLLLLPLALLPLKFNITGPVSALIASLAGVYFIFQTFKLVKEQTDKAALRIMFASFIYLTVVQLAFLFDKVA